MELHVVKSGQFFLSRSKLSKHPNLASLAKKKMDTEILEEENVTVVAKKR